MLKNINCYILIAGLCLTSCARLYAVENKLNVNVFKVSDREMFKAHISPLLYGNFIEIGYGYETEPMINQMFFNRSFERFDPYTVPSKMWFDLYFNENDRSQGYEKDWSVFDWYHSGYEHSWWYPAPGTPPSSSIIKDGYSFIQSASNDINVRISTIKGGKHGEQCVRIDNNELDRWGGMAQNDIFLKKGEYYDFSGLLQAVEGMPNAEIRIYRDGTWDDPLHIIHLGGVALTMQPYKATFFNKDYEGRAKFSLWIPPKTSVIADDFSLKFSTNFYGWRKDVVNLIRRIGPKVIRFPGGCFASFNDWRQSIGPHENRTPTPSYFWGGLNSNDIGVEEFAMLCKEVGAEMSYCVNVFHPSKRRYESDFPSSVIAHGYDLFKFTSIDQGAKAAADLVAYCNLRQGEHPMADLRVKNGYKEPFGIKFWEMENEPMRWFNAEDYAWAVMIYSQAMKQVDPSIKIGLATYGDRQGWTASPTKDSYHKKVAEMLEITGKYVDFIANRGDFGDGTYGVIRDMNKYNKENGTKIKYCDTEWLAFWSDESRDAFNKQKRHGGVTNSYRFSKWLYGLNLIKNFLAFQRLGEDILFVNFNNMGNCHSQSCLESPKEGAYLTASGLALEMLSQSPAKWLLEFEDYKAAENDEYQVQAAWDVDKKRLVLFVCNRTDCERITEFDISSLHKTFKKVYITTLGGVDGLTMNSLKYPNAIKKTYIEKKLNNEEMIRLEAPIYSFIEIVLE